MMNTIILKRRQCLCLSDILLLVLPVLLFMLNGCSGGIKLVSDWQQGEMNIDGSDLDWQRGLYYNKESDIVYGVRNDDKYIYVLLKTHNRFTQMQILRQGLTIWFDREGEKNQTFGIQYPISRQKIQDVLFPDSSEENPRTFLDQAFPELEIIGPKKEDVQRFSTLAVPGINVKLGRTRETLIYELRVPLKKTSEHPFAIEPISSNRVGIEFETGKFKTEQGNTSVNPGSVHNSGEEMGEYNPTEADNFGDRRYRDGGQSSRFGSIGKTRQLEFWLFVQLAKSVSQ